MTKKKKKTVLKEPADPAVPPMTIHVERFKSLEDVEVELGQVNVFIGANGAGKSNLLEALGVLGSAAAGRIDDQALLRRGVRPGVPRIYKSAFPARKKDPSIRLTVKAGDSSYFIAISNQSDKPKPAWHFHQERLEHGALSIAVRSVSQATIHGEKLLDERTASLSVQARGNLKTPQETRELLEQLDNFAIYAPVTPMLRGIAADTAQRAPVGLFGGGLPDAVDGIPNGTRKRFRQHALDLIDWAEDFGVGPPSRSFIASSVPTMRRVVTFRDRFMKKADQTLSGYDASEGSLYILFTLVLAMHPLAPRLFAIDNFDQALNPAIARELVKEFTSEVLRGGSRALLTTHNPLVLDGLPLDDDRVRLFRVERKGDGRSVIARIPVKNVARLKQLHGQHAVSRLWIEGQLGGMPRVRAV